MTKIGLLPINFNCLTVTCHPIHRLPHPLCMRQALLQMLQVRILMRKKLTLPLVLQVVSLLLVLSALFLKRDISTQAGPAHLPQFESNSTNKFWAQISASGGNFILFLVSGHTVDTLALTGQHGVGIHTDKWGQRKGILWLIVVQFSCLWFCRGVCVLSLQRDTEAKRKRWGKWENIYHYPFSICPLGIFGHSCIHTLMFVKPPDMRLESCCQPWGSTHLNHEVPRIYLVDLVVLEMWWLNKC